MNGTIVVTKGPATRMVSKDRVSLRAESGFEEDDSDQMAKRVMMKVRLSGTMGTGLSEALRRHRSFNKAICVKQVLARGATASRINYMPYVLVSLVTH